MLRLWLFLVLILASGTAGCSIHPLPEDVTEFSTVDIVEKIRCEAKAAIHKYIPRRDYPSGGIGYDFTFTMTENNDAGGAGKFSLPFSKGRFSLDLNVGEKKQRQTERKVMLVDTFGELRNARCPSGPSQPHWRYPITGTIGLNEVVSTFARLDRPASELASFTDTLVFTTKISGSASPRIELTPLIDRFRLTEASASFLADRQDVHKVTVTLTAKPAKPRKFVAPDIREKIVRDLYNQRSLENTEKILDILRGR